MPIKSLRISEGAARHMQSKIRLIEDAGGLADGEEVLFEDDAIAVTNRRVLSRAAGGAGVDAEDVLFADDRIAVTARRLIGNFGAAKEGAFDEVELSLVGAPNRFNGGYQSRRPLALRLLGGGLAVVVAGAFFTDALRAVHYTIEPLVFLIGALAATVGVYLLLNSLFRHRPNTTIIFPVLEGDEIIASYPEWDNPRADELTRHFARAKRSLSR